MDKHFMSDQYLYLTTIGHKSGNPHEIEIWYVAHDDCYYLISEKYERSHWVQNIKANSDITFRLGDKNYKGTGRIPSDESLIHAVKQKMDDKYNWSEGLVVQLCVADI